jgi:replicative DNA helicase
MAYNLGLKVIRRFAEEQNPLRWYKAKLTPQLFYGEDEQIAFKWCDDHLKAHHTIPQVETLEAQFPVFKQFTTPEPSSYYVTLLENRFGFDTIKKASNNSLLALASNKDDIDGALLFLEQAKAKIAEQKYRTRILDLGKEGPSLVLNEYHGIYAPESIIEFGWPYMDNMTGGALAGDVISFVGRPAAGKTFKMLKTAIHNWQIGANVLFVSMEMNVLAVAQRLAAMYAHTGLTQLKMKGYGTATYNKFSSALMNMTEHENKFYTVDGNLAASVEDIYILAEQLKCSAVYIDGAYLLKHKNPRLDRYTRVAENVELIKQNTSAIEVPTICSWQFSREAAKKGKATGQKVGLEDIGYSDAIGQISSIVMGLFQEEGVETMQTRLVDVLKGRNGEVGQFSINWDFINMDFTEVGVIAVSDTQALNYI